MNDVLFVAELVEALREADPQSEVQSFIMDDGTRYIEFQNKAGKPVQLYLN